MEKAHAKATEAIQTFVAEASAAHATPRFIATLIQRATTSPATFVFGELLNTPAVRKLEQDKEASQEYRSYLKLLEVFSWGTWEEYQSTPNLPTLNEAQSKKLRLLSLISLATEHVPLPYDVAMKALSLDTPLALEALVTEAIYLDLIAAKMAPASEPPVIHVTTTAPMRDIRPETMTNLLSTLDSWQQRCQSTVLDLQKQIDDITQAAETRHMDNDNLNLENMNPAMSMGQKGDELKREALKPASQISRTAHAMNRRASEVDQEGADSTDSPMEIDFDANSKNHGVPL